ncbi:DUF2267 domain-containing protein [Streptomyces sp. NPDC004539]|uniref:DUF2267 domain-containing protein n=1 Tax=Streptomyces sp. NPDC004539 TaxID=3154280 RepID=UPI0033BF8219
MTKTEPHATDPKPAEDTSGRAIPAPRHSLIRTPEPWPHLVARVKRTGQYPTTADAERITRTTLTSLAPLLPAPERTALTRTLPPEAAALLTPRTPANLPSPAAEFVTAVAAHLNNESPDKARWHVTSVLTVLSHLAGPTLTARIINQLPQGYALLFGRAELMRKP